MAAPTKTLYELLDPQSLATASRVAGPVIDVSEAHEIGFAGWMARFGTSAHTSPFAELGLWGSVSPSSDGLWMPVRQLFMPAGANVAVTTATAAILAGTSSFTVASATNIAMGALLFVDDPTASNLEVVSVRSVSGSTINIDGTFAFAHANGAYVSSQAERIIVPALNVSGLSRVRAEARNKSGQTVFVRMTGLVVRY